jgi:MoaA/NifB/PqqE/SkfB family radical SAM enzyme
MQIIEQVYQKAGRARVPLTIHFDLTYRCHQRCVHCYLPESWRQGAGPGPELTTAQVKNILDQLAAAGAFFIGFSGGESFQRSDLFEILTYARRRNFSIALFSSGTWKLGDEQLKSLAELGLEALLVSVYSLDSEVHDQITGIPGSSALLWRTVERGLSAGLQVVFNCVVMEANYSGVSDLIDYAGERGIPLRVDDLIKPRWDKQPHQAGLALDGPAHEQLTRIVYGPEQEPPGQAPDLEWRCCAGMYHAYISPRGEVWPCIDLPIPCGNLRDGESFESLWQDARMMHEVRAWQSDMAGKRERLCDLHCQNGQIF